MGLIWAKLWKQTEVAGKAAKFATVQWAGHNFAMVQWAGLGKLPICTALAYGQYLNQFGGHGYAKEHGKEVYGILDEKWLSGAKSSGSWSTWMRLVWVIRRQVHG